MKLLHLIGSMNPCGGGPCQGIRNQAVRSVEQGHTVEVVCLDDPDSDYFSQETLRIHALGKGRNPWNYNPALPAWLKTNLPRFDAVILNGLWQYQGYALAKAARGSKSPPYFVFPHGMLDPWFQRCPDRRLKALRNWLYWKLVEQYVIRNADAVLFTCGEEMRLASQSFRPYQPRRQLDVGYGVSAPPEFHKGMKEVFWQKCPGLNGRPYFLFLGRIHPKKGVHFLIEAYSAHCHAAGSSQPSNLVIAGPDLDSPYGQKMQKLASETCPRDSVFWPGMLSGDAKWGAVYGCEASVLPSNQENFGISVVETLACGRAVLISDQINIWREIKESGAALVDQNSAEGMTRMFLAWSKLSPSAKSYVAAQAKPCFQRYFSIESATGKLLAAISSTTKTP